MRGCVTDGWMDDRRIRGCVIDRWTNRHDMNVLTGGLNNAAGGLMDRWFG